MIKGLPVQINLVFILSTVLCFVLFIRAVRYNRVAISIFLGLLIVQGTLALSGFYTGPGASNRFPILIIPSMLVILIVFITKSGQHFTERLSLRSLTWLHVVRVPVEFVLHWLFLQKLIPGAMTFEGYNYDILSGLYAPVMVMFAFRKRFARRKWMIGWNIVCLLLLLNIVIISALSTPAPFQYFGKGQPNRAILFFPFVWLPSCIVPVVLYAHLAALRKLFRHKGDFIS